MKSPLLLRIASVISLLFAAGHSLGGRDSWSPMGETDVLRAMKDVRFETMGVTRTYWDFYLGFGLSLSVFLLLQAVQLWQLAAIAKRDPSMARPMTLSVLVASLASAAIAWRFIFAVPAFFALALAACLALALLASFRSG